MLRCEDAWRNEATKMLGEAKRLKGYGGLEAMRNWKGYERMLGGLSKGFGGRLGILWEPLGDY